MLRDMLDKYDGQDADVIRGITSTLSPQAYKEGGRVKREPSLQDYWNSVASTFGSLPEAPGAIYDLGERAVRAVPGAVRSGVQYIRQHTPQQVAQDVTGGLTRVARHVREHPVSTVADVIPFVGEAKQYGEDVRRAAALRAMGDLAGARDIERLSIPLAAASLIPGVGEARSAGKAARLAEDAARVIEHEAAPVAKGVTRKTATNFPVKYGTPIGDLNLRPNIDPVNLKGGETQRVEDFINQLRGQPGVTKEGLAELVKAYEPGARMTKAEFGQGIPGSQFNKVDLGNTADDIDEHLYQEARYMVNNDTREVFGRMAENLGLNYQDAHELEDIVYNGTNLADENIVDHLRTELGANNSGELRRMLSDMYSDVHSEAVQDTMERLRDYADPGDYSGYAYQDYQRLVPEDMQKNSGYFELGVTHPGMEDFESVDYRGGHYPKAENLAGHIRGTFNPKNLLSGATHYGSNFSSPATVDELIGGSAQRAYQFRPKPNSMVIEELQSDPAKTFGNEGPLHQIHGTLFKAAIQHALENGVDTVYLPTAKTIGLTRFANPSAYAPIYDKEVIKYGLNPLREIPGVEVNPIDDVYHEINVSPEAKEAILGGRGQKMPGFAEGGAVASDDVKEFNLADIDQVIKDVMSPKDVEGVTVTPRFQPGYGADLDFDLSRNVGGAQLHAHKSLRGGADYGVDFPLLGGDVSLGASADRGFKPNRARLSYRRNFAEGGLVSSYDEAMVDDLANQIREGIYG